MAKKKAEHVELQLRLPASTVADLEEVARAAACTPEVAAAVILALYWRQNCPKVPE